MPLYVLADSGAVLLGGLLGALMGTHISNELKAVMNKIFGLCSIAIGICSLTHTATLSALVLATILGAVVGTLAHLELRLNGLTAKLSVRLTSGSSDNAEYIQQFISVLVLFCASGTGIFGSIQYGATGDGSILLAKSILDFFSAVLFASSLGKPVSLISLPQCLIFCALFFCGPLLLRVSNATALEDFTACGGVLMVATGLRITGICSFPLVDMLPSLVFIIPFSTLWNLIF